MTQLVDEGLRTVGSFILKIDELAIHRDGPWRACFFAGEAEISVRADRHWTVQRVTVIAEHRPPIPGQLHRSEVRGFTPLFGYIVRALAADCFDTIEEGIDRVLEADKARRADHD